MTALPDGARICSVTGLVLVPAASETGWRIAKTSYGPLNPPLRSNDPDADPASWGRFDTRGGRTVYLAATRECAFAEVLAYQRRKLGERDSLAKDAAFLGLEVADLVATVEHEWQDRGHPPPGHVGKGWRTERAMYEIPLPDKGWWVLLEHPDSIAAAEAALEDQLASVGVGELDVAVLRGHNRDATVLLASWVCDAVLDDGSKAHGIRFESRHATGGVWAHWIRPDGRGSVYVGTAIDESDEDLVRVADRIGLRIW